MKLAIAIIFALVCSTIADDAVKACEGTSKWFDGKACQDCPAGCKACVGKGGKANCLDCGKDSSKYLAIDGEVGSCKDCVKDCLACRGDGVSNCFNPAADMKVSPTAIVKCTGLTGCLWCSAENKCGKCQVGYRLDKDACTPCTDKSCLDCSADVAKCTKCAYWTKLDKDACTACDNGCKDCPCTGCKDGAAFKDGKCTPCTDFQWCEQCPSDAGKCTKCAAGSFLKDDKCTACVAGCAECSAADTCSKCKAGFAIKDGKTCTPCPDKCETCDADGKCSKCATNYWVNADKKCTMCDLGCDGCSATDGTCTKCKPGFWLNDDKKGCKQCTTSCKECADASKCKTCLDSAVIKDGACKDVGSCPFGQAMKDDQTCVAGTIDNCARGNVVTGTCPYCSAGFYTKDKTCANCPNGCKDCSNDNGYVKCTSFGQDGFSWVNDTNAKVDKAGYLGKDSTYTLLFNGNDNQCMPNSWGGICTKEITKHKCVGYDSCPMIFNGPNFMCAIECSAVKMTLTLFAVVVAALFTL